MFYGRTTGEERTLGHNAGGETSWSVRVYSGMYDARTWSGDGHFTDNTTE